MTHPGQDPEDLPEDGEVYHPRRPWSYWLEKQRERLEFLDEVEGSE